LFEIHSGSGAPAVLLERHQSGFFGLGDIHCAETTKKAEPFADPAFVIAY
jgi:hypothetical protein